MNQEILNHCLKFSVFTNPGCHREFFGKLPGNVRELGNLISSQVIHRKILREGNTFRNADRRYGDMDEFPWHRMRCEDELLPNAVSMAAELLRLDGRGFRQDRRVEHKIVVTCRNVAVLAASILKSKGIPCRVRSGFAPYLVDGISTDHWINEYWDGGEGRWIVFDADGFFDFLDFDQYDMDAREFDWAAKTWLGIRNGEMEAGRFANACGVNGLQPALWAVIYDYHSLMNDEITYPQMARKYCKFENLGERDFGEIDELAGLMLEPDSNFRELRRIWEGEDKFRVMNSVLVSDADHVK